MEIFRVETCVLLLILLQCAPGSIGAPGNDTKESNGCNDHDEKCSGKSILQNQTMTEVNVNNQHSSNKSAVEGNHPSNATVSLRSGFGFDFTYPETYIPQQTYQHEQFGEFVHPQLYPFNSPQLQKPYDPFQGLEDLMPEYCREPDRKLPVNSPRKPIPHHYASYGENVEENEFPWLAVLLYDTTEGKELGCGGSLITRWHVLTAAHCTKGHGIPADWTLSSVRLGNWEARFDPRFYQNYNPSGSAERLDPKHLEVAIDNVYVHEEFAGSETDYANDIALVLLSYPVSFIDKVRPICLPINEDIPNDLTVVGWGETETGSRGKEPKKLIVPVLNINSCAAEYRKYSSRQLNTKQICAGGNFGKDFCAGDSGGPLAESKNSRVKHLFGIVSHGYGDCGQQGLPGIYTNVKEYLPWIARALHFSRKFTPEIIS